MPVTGRISVLAGTNGAGKSSIAGQVVRDGGGQYFNPDEVARRILELSPTLLQTEANALAWREGVEQLRAAIQSGQDYTFETTLGGNTIVQLLEEAAGSGLEVRVWYAGLSSPELHIRRVAARVRKGGHDIPKADIRRRYAKSQINLIHLMPRLTALMVFDNSVQADPAKGRTPEPVLVLHMEHGKIMGPRDLKATPEWAKAIVAAALKLARS
ncbi:MAG TPA: AAA family ATPase [Thermoanaerobaculia bacterium]|nr:AAA family ATPase [Thermoanaerobaculia bacterium]